MRRDGLIGIGSNIGDRRKHLRGAVDALPGSGVKVIGCSSLYDTDPVGEVLEQASFLNACLAVETELEPLELLDAAKALERALGRAEGGVRHGPRPIDIDILMLGDLTVQHERLVLPHPQLLSRRFVLIPALELDMELTTPEGIRLADVLPRLDVGEGVRWSAPPIPILSARAPATPAPGVGSG